MFKYLDKVKIKEGFYEGKTGRVVEELSSKNYEVELDSDNYLHKKIIVKENNLEKL